MQYGFHFNGQRCTGCKTCMLACKDFHDLGYDVAFRQVYEYGGGTWEKDAEGALSQDCFTYYVSVACNHCAKPVCVKVCPTGAMHKDDRGIVTVDGQRCIGCGSEGRSRGRSFCQVRPLRGSAGCGEVAHLRGGLPAARPGLRRGGRLAGALRYGGRLGAAAVRIGNLPPCGDHASPVFGRRALPRGHRRSAEPPRDRVARGSTGHGAGPRL